MDIVDIPPWCLYDTIASLPSQQVPAVAIYNKELADVCTSGTLWHHLYNREFRPLTFKIQKEEADVNWAKRFSERYAIPKNIKSRKPKVKSYPIKTPGKSCVRVFGNSFAFSTETELHIIGYDYRANECVYEELEPFVVPHLRDFVFLDVNSIVAISETDLRLIKINTRERRVFNIDVTEMPRIQPLVQDTFAVIEVTCISVYRIGVWSCDKICEVLHASDKAVIATDSIDMTLFIATSKDITAYNVGNPRGPIIWVYYSQEPRKFCTINMQVKVALFGDVVVNMDTGRTLSIAHVDEAVCGCVMNDHLVIIGCQRQSVVFYDYVKQQQMSTVLFGEGEEIRSITSGLSGSVAVAGNYTIRLYNVTDEVVSGTCQTNVVPVRTINVGSRGLRQDMEIPMVSGVYFDGERCITDNQSKMQEGDECKKPASNLAFVRVYDFYHPSK